MSRLSLLRTDDFTGGLNLRADPFQLGRTESPDLLNVDIDPRGGLTVRGGMTKLNTSAIGGISNGAFTPKGLYAWDNSSPRVLLAANNVVYGASTTAFSTIGVNTTAPFGASFTSWSASTESFVYIGTGALTHKWDGTNTASSLIDASTAYADDYAAPVTGYAPKCRQIASHVIVCGVRIRLKVALIIRTVCVSRILLIVSRGRLTIILTLLRVVRGSLQSFLLMAIFLCLRSVQCFLFWVIRLTRFKLLT